MLLEEGSPSAPPTESSALATRKTSQPARNNNDSRTPQQGEQMRCNHCNRHGHTHDICWKIHGKPTNWVPQRQTEGRGCQTQSNQDKEATTENQTSILFSKEQIEQLCHLLNQSPAPSSSTPSLGSCFVAQSGVSNFSLSYAPCPSSTKVKIADGSLSSVAGIDLSLGRMIDSARVHEGLYFLEDTENERRQAFVTAVNNLPLKTFECTSFVHLHSQHRTKLDPQTIKTIFLGYSPTQKGYRCYCPKTKKMFISQDVTFFEEVPYYSPTSLQGENHDQEARVWDWDTTALPISETPSMSTTSLPKTTAASPITPKFTSSKTEIAATTPITAELTP
ncbi:hypothetical protein CK203_039395 [Vitis vinifera]|uniref:Retroviral polymerase SH3-like domain-containing protein n=1 Tax=Vitis vinifera TaxID=29760 RepID=A0A438I7D8_VITVI|nr:hypothetical protein CK203_039395 [Vitis vinifera]